MDEAEWLGPADARKMSLELRRRNRSRVLHYFACHCCRLAWPAVTDERSRAAVEVTEQYLIGRASLTDYEAAVQEAYQAHQDARAARDTLIADRTGTAEYWAARMRSMSTSLATHLVHYATANGYYDGMYGHLRDALSFARIGPKAPERTQLLYKMRDVLRELAGNPFRPVTFSPD